MSVFFWKVSLVKSLYGKGFSRRDIFLLYKFIINASDAVRIEELIKLLNETVSKETGGIVMSLASRLKIEGIEEGIEKGIEKGELIGDIRVAQLMKGLPMTDKKELEKLSIDNLKKKLEEINKNS